MEPKQPKVINRPSAVKAEAPRPVTKPAAMPSIDVQTPARGGGSVASLPSRAAASADLPMPSKPAMKSEASKVTSTAPAAASIPSARVSAPTQAPGAPGKGASAPTTVQSPAVARVASATMADGGKPAAQAAAAQTAVAQVAAAAQGPAAAPAAGEKKGAAGGAGGAAAAAGGAGEKSAAAGGAGKKGGDKKEGDEKKPAAGGKGGKGGKKGKDDAAGEASEEKAPTSAKDDPAFQAVVSKTKNVAEQQKSHPPAEQKAAEAQAAAVEPPAAVMSKGQARQVDEMEQAPTPAFDGAAFKEALMKRISELTPKNLEEADEFEENDKLGGVKDEMGGKVEAEKANSQGPLEEKAKEEPSTEGIEEKPVTDLPAADAGKAPGSVGAKGAVPKKKGTSEIEAPLKEESKSLDDQMAEENVTDEQLQKSNEPKFMSASKAKDDAQTHAETAPKGVRQFEKKTLSKAEQEATAFAQREVQGMYSDRSKGLKQVEGDQKQAKGKDEAARAKVAADIEAIYASTKERVDTILNDLDAKVETAFDAGAAKAKETFETYVEEKMDAYKDERYSGVLGKGQWLADLFMDLPEEVNRFYEDGRDLYLAEMDKVLDEVIAIIGNELTAARTEIQKGKDEISAYVAQLPNDLKGVGEEASEAVADKFAQLEDSVQNKQGELIDTLAQKYQENLDAVDERIKELKEANKGLISKAAGLIRDVIEAIKKLRKLLNQILNRIAHIISLIIADPIGFFDNLMTGLKRGFNNFVANIETHLITGLFAWLTGALGPISIKVPENLFSLKGIFNLVMQVLGLTWDAIRAKAVKLFGEPVVAAMEMGAEMFQKLREGPDALWEFVKEQFTDIKEMVLDQIKEMVITEVVKAGVKWLLSLLNPAAAFIKAAMAIYSIISFIFNRAAQIADFINSLLDAIEAIAKGAVDGAAAMVEKALAKSIPLIIGLLAALLGISGLVKKVQKLIEKIRKRIDKAIMKILIKAKSLVGKLGKSVSGAVAGVINWWKKRMKFKGADGKSHSLYFSGEGRSAKLMVASTPTLVETYLDNLPAATKTAKKSEIDKIEVHLKTIKTLSALPEDQQALPANENQFTNAFNAIGPLLADVLSDGDWGSDKNPIRFVYTKRRIQAYPTLYIGPYSSKPIPQTVLATKNAATIKSHMDPTEAAAWDGSIKTISPTKGGNLPDGTPLGIKAASQIEVGRKLLYNPPSGKTPGGKKINSALKPYGFSPEGEKLDGDHVHEIQLGGKDEITNLWPLDRSENRSSGSLLKDMTVDMPDGKKATLKDAEKKRPGDLWLIITSTRNV